MCERGIVEQTDAPRLQELALETRCYSLGVQSIQSRLSTSHWMVRFLFGLYLAVL